jgi:hypothetical protein
MTLFEYFTSLAEKGETALIVKQIDTGKKCLDGSPRYTWPAYLPSHKRRQGESWFLNTGSFILDRFEDGKPAATKNNCTHVLFFMLDDIGETKNYDGEIITVKQPPLPPTAIVETSKNSFQYWYAYSEQPTIEEQTSLINAMARQDYTDRGAKNAVRNCRLPGSLNRKPGRDDFICREVSFDPSIEYTLDEIVEGFGLVLDPVLDSVHHIRLTDTGSDDVVAWLNESKLVISRPNAAGWMGVVCPNHEQHSDGSLEGRYMPQSRAFCCHHGHCTHLTSEYYLNWVAEQGGPRHKPGLREDILADMLSEIPKPEPTEAFPDDAARRIADVEKMQAGRETRAGWHARFAYVAVDDSYFDRYTCTEISRKAFNALYKHIECSVQDSAGKTRRVEASTWFDTFREQLGGYALHGMTYAAGDDWRVHRDGLVYGNVWRDGRPKVTSGGDPQRWLDHCRKLVPDERELNHILDVMAFKLRNPRVKINHAILHGGHGGSGKDTMWAPFFWAVSGETLRNVKIVDGDKIVSDWGYHYQSEVIVLNELKEPEARDRRAMANKLKPVIAAPPEMLTVNRKSLHPYEMPNRLLLVAFTNEDMPITLDSDDRRWFCVWSSAPRMKEADFLAMWDWYKSGGFEAVAHWLYQRDISAFNPKLPPMETDYKRKLIYTGMSQAESYIYHLIEAGSAPFHRGMIAGPWHDILRELSSQANTDGPNGSNSIRIVQPALFHALKEAGWVDKGLCYSKEYKNKKHIFVKRELARLSNSEIRREWAIMSGEEAPKENVYDFPKSIQARNGSSGGAD